MTRSFENTRLRRIMMQAALCAALLATIGLAWWVGHVHAAALTVKLDEKYGTFNDKTMSLDVRKPIGWKTEYGGFGTKKEDIVPALLAVEQAPRYGGPRTLYLFVLPLRGSSSGSAEADAVKVASDVLLPTPPNPSRSLKVLGATGFLFEYPRKVFETREGGVEVLPECLLACAVLPGPRPVAVCVYMTGMTTAAPADIDAVISVAEALKGTDPAHPLPSIVEDPEDVPVFGPPVRRGN